MRIAVIGSGISGLSAAHWLQRRHEVTVFEANDYVGGHTNTVEVEIDGEKHAVDTGFIVFNDRTYPNFRRLLNELGVTSRPTVMSFSVHDESSGLEYNGHTLNSLFAQRRNLLRPKFYRLLADILRFNRDGVRLAAAGDAGATVGEFLKRHRYSQVFAQQYLLPMGSAIWSCPTGVFSEFPMQFVVEFYANHGLLQIADRPVWQVIDGGSQAYVRAMLRGFQRQVQLRAPVIGIRRFADRIELQFAGGNVERFDHAIFACHSDQALQILGDTATAKERAVLSEFPYEKNKAVLHTDESLLPRSRRAWASWNYRLTAPDHPATVTYNMNILQGIKSRHTLCVTLNGESKIAPERILRRFDYSHPIFTTRRAAAQARHPELLLANRTSFCGAYWGNGFHEDGVNSALAVVRALNKVEGNGLPRESDLSCRATKVPTVGAANR